MSQIVHTVRTVRGANLHTIFEKQQNKEETLLNKILQELIQRGGEFAENASVILELLTLKISGKPMDDRSLVIERTIKLVAKLPETSIARRGVTGILVEELWDSLPHPPQAYVGDLHNYRQADGSYNNIYNPDLGKAGTPYSRTVPSVHRTNGAKPDAGLLFDLLMSRGDEFEENPAGISSMLLYHASIITHDIFHTNRENYNINDTSSYLDLSPLYGSSQEQQNAVRAKVDGLLKPDTFSERRLIGFPPGVNVMLVMYSRFHNYVAKTLKAINEGGRFTAPHGKNWTPERRQEWEDEQLFQVARLVTNGLYINVSLHDYLRAIANVPATASSWTLDPRVEIKKPFGKEVAKGVGNHVSCEFNLLYRFHSAISKRDAKWTEDFYADIFQGKDLNTIPIPELLKGLSTFEESISDDPGTREFAGLKRQENGTFKDEDLVNILKESIQDPAGRFGANHVPDILKPVEILGIIQARKWNVASLNEFRDFFKLKRYEKFEEINSDPYVVKTLERLYGHPDNVELYPGMFLEDVKPVMEAGMGLCAPYSVTRAVFSDAITLVRGDRLLTKDYTHSNLTNWGITEVAPDYDNLGGARMSQLILNAFPNHFKFNSVYAMQPFYTPDASRKIFEKLGTADLYSFDAPASHSTIIPIGTHAALKAVLSDNKNFKVPWGAKMASLETYMLASDSAETAKQRELVGDCIYGVDGALQKFAEYSKEITLKLLQQEAYELGRKGTHQVDVVKDIGNIAALHFAAELCYLPLLASTGPSYTEAELYKVLTDLTWYVFSDADPTKSWARRRDSQRGTEKLVKEMEQILTALPASAAPAGCPRTNAGRLFGTYEPKTIIGTRLKDRVKQRQGSQTECTDNGGTLGAYGSGLARTLLDTGKTCRQVAEILVGTASAFVANTATAFAQVLDFYLEPANAAHWAAIQELTAKGTPEADELLSKYVLEGMRLSNALGIFREVDGSTTIEQNGHNIPVKKGDRLFISFVAASRDPTAFPEPLEIRTNRPMENYITFGQGPHQCLGKDLNIVHTRTMLKVFAGLKGLRRTPGDEGRLKCITKPGGFKMYLTPDWSQLTPYPTTMKIMWDGTV